MCDVYHRLLGLGQAEIPLSLPQKLALVDIIVVDPLGGGAWGLEVHWTVTMVKRRPLYCLELQQPVRHHDNRVAPPSSSLHASEVQWRIIWSYFIKCVPVW